MFVLLMAEISMRWIHNSSVFEPQSQNHVSCDKYWWRNILYINSLYPMKDMVNECDAFAANHRSKIIRNRSCSSLVDFKKFNRILISISVHVMELVRVERYSILCFRNFYFIILNEVSNLSVCSKRIS